MTKYSRFEGFLHGDGVTLRNKDASSTKRRRRRGKKSGVLLFEWIFPGKESFVDVADVFNSSNVLLCVYTVHRGSTQYAKNEKNSAEANSIYDSVALL